jgi:hypothetical protein
LGTPALPQNKKERVRFGASSIVLGHAENKFRKSLLAFTTSTGHVAFE